MIPRVILYMKDWLSNTARVKLLSLSGLVVAFLTFHPAPLLLLALCLWRLACQAAA